MQWTLIYFNLATGVLDLFQNSFVQNTLIQHKNPSKITFFFSIKPIISGYFKRSYPFFMTALHGQFFDEFFHLLRSATILSKRSAQNHYIGVTHVKLANPLLTQIGERDTIIISVKCRPL